VARDVDRCHRRVPLGLSVLDARPALALGRQNAGVEVTDRHSVDHDQASACADGRFKAVHPESLFRQLCRPAALAPVECQPGIDREQATLHQSNRPSRGIGSPLANATPSYRPKPR
jgi:hypothetical protein